MNILRENKALQREILALLSNECIQEKDRALLQQNFIKNYYEVIKLSFDLNITKEKLKEYSKKIKNFNNPNTLLKIGSVVENKKTYILLNIYLKKYLNLLSFIV